MIVTILYRSLKTCWKQVLLDCCKISFRPYFTNLWFKNMYCGVKLLLVFILCYFLHSYSNFESFFGLVMCKIKTSQGAENCVAKRIFKLTTISCSCSLANALPTEIEVLSIFLWFNCLFGSKIRQITRPCLAIRQKLAASGIIRVWTYEKVGQVIRLGPESNTYILDKYAYIDGSRAVLSYRS